MISFIDVYRQLVSYHPVINIFEFAVIDQIPKNITPKLLVIEINFDLK